MGSLCRIAILLLLAVLPGFGLAQSTQIIATSVNSGGVALTNGQLCLIAVTPTGQPQNFSANGRLYLAGDLAHVQGGFCGAVYSGALAATLNVPDRAAATSSAPLCYEVMFVGQRGQVSDLGTRCDITGSSVSLNTYVPPATRQFNVTGYTTGATVPASCSLGALFLNTTTNHLYSCGTDSTFHDMAGSGSGTSDYNQLINHPTLSAVATSGSYTDLANKPTIPVLSAATISAALSSITGCSTPGYVYSPASGTCGPPSSGGATLPSTSNLYKGNGSGGAVAATPDTDYALPSTVANNLALAIAAERATAAAAQNITSGTLDPARLPSIPTSKVAKTILYASKLTGVHQDTIAATGTGLSGSGTGTDDWAVLQAAINAAAQAGPVKLIQDGGSTLTATLTLPSYSEIDCLNPNNGFFMANGSGATVIRIGSGPSSPSDPQIAAPAQGTSAGIENCAINGNRGNGTVGNSQNGNYRGTGNYTSIYVNNYAWLFDVDVMNMQNVWLRNNTFFNAPTYSLRMTNVSHVDVRGNRFKPFADSDPVTDYGNTDGVHIDGPASDIRVIGNSGRTGDDFVAVNAPEGYGGLVQNVVVADNVCELCLSFSRIYTGSIAAPSGAATAKISGVVMANNTATVLHTGFIVGLESGRAVTTTDSITDVILSNNTIHGGCNYAWLLDNIGTLSITKGDWYSPTCDGSVTSSTGSYLLSGLTPATFRHVSVTSSQIIRDANGSSATMFLDNFGKIYNQTPGTAVFKNLHVSGFGMVDAGGASYGAGSMFNVKANSITNITLGDNDYTLMQLSPTAIYNAGATQPPLVTSGLNLGQCAIFGVAACYGKGFAMYDDGSNLDNVDLVPGAFRLTTDGSTTGFDFGFGNYTRSSRTSWARFDSTAATFNIPLSVNAAVATLNAGGTYVDRLSSANLRLLALGANTSSNGVVHIVSANSAAGNYQDSTWDGTTFVIPGIASSNSVIGPATAPTGTCSKAGVWVFSQDGHATYCPSAGGTWTTKI